MHARERLIQERFATQTCSECGWPYAPRGVLVLARRRSAWMVLVTCAQCSRRGIFVVSFPAHEAPAESLLRRESLEAAAASGTPGTDDHTQGTLDCEPISLDEVDQMHAFLANFDGDFRRAFASPPPAPPTS